MNTPGRMLVIFNHSLTDAQRADAKAGLGVAEFIAPPANLLATWGQLPPDTATLAQLLVPLFNWLREVGREGDYVLVQGDFGATHLVVQKAMALGMTPVYSTTRREAMEVRNGDAISLTHHFRHVRFRLYEELCQELQP